MSEAINTTYGSILTTAVLICDPITFSNGSPDAIASRSVVGTQPVDAALELQSCQGGLLIPRLTSKEIDNLVTVNGMLAYNKTTNEYYFYQKEVWLSMLAIGNIASTATSGEASLPENPAGFVEAQINGSTYKIPYYNV